VTHISRDVLRQELGFNQRIAIEIVDLPFKNGDLPAFQHSVFWDQNISSAQNQLVELTHEGAMWHS